MSLNLLSGLLGGGNTSRTTSTTSTAMPSTTYSYGAYNPFMGGGASYLGGLSYPMSGIANNLISGINGSGTGGFSLGMPATSSFGMSPSVGGYYGFQPMTSYGSTMGMGGYSPMYSGGYYMPSFNYGGTVTSGTTTGSNSGSSSTSGSGGLLGPGLGSLVGGIAQGAHGLAENLINATGLGGIFGPLIDDPIIHPLLWDPISMLTGFDVSKHPEGVADVSDPLGVRSGQSSGSGGSSSSGGLLGGLLGGLF